MEDKLDELLKKYEKIQKKIQEKEKQIRNLKEKDNMTEIIKYTSNNNIEKIQLKGGELWITRSKCYKPVNKNNIKESLLLYNIKDIEDIIKHIYNRDYKTSVNLKYIENKK